MSSSAAAEGKEAEPETQLTESVYSFADADVCILSAPNENGKRVRYRLHKSILAAFSGTFNDMFSLPTPSEGEPTPSDPELPAIQLEEPEEVLHGIFAYIYANRGLGRYDIRAQRTYRLVSVCIAADKYHIASVQNSVETYLTEYLERHKQYDDSMGEYETDFDTSTMITLFGYAYGNDNEELKDLASDAVWRSLDKENRTMADVEVQDTQSLSGPALHKLWSMQYRHLQSIKTSLDEERALLATGRETSAKTINALLKLPKVGPKHSEELCFQRDVVPCWSRIVRQGLDISRYPTVLAHPSVPQIVQNLRKANYGDCKTCKEAVDMRCAAILTEA